MTTYDDIWALRPTESDFEEILDEFSPQERRTIYVGMNVWCTISPSEEFRKRRLAIESDPLCRKLLDSRNSWQGSWCTRSVRTPEAGSTDLKRNLITLVEEYLRDSANPAASGKIMSLRAAEADFDDEFFEAFLAEQRLDIYSMLLLWCGPQVQRRILQSRSEVESDESCRIAISVMLRSQG